MDPTQDPCYPLIGEAYKKCNGTWVDPYVSTPWYDHPWAIVGVVAALLIIFWVVWSYRHETKAEKIIRIIESMPDPTRPRGGARAQLKARNRR